MYLPSCFLIHCQTNLHAGSGDTNYGIIDKMVQRDVVTQLVSIYSSSLKGALREYFEEGPEKSTLAQKVTNIFGAKVNDAKNESNATGSKGNTIFHEAQLIGFPMRSNQRPYFIATSKVALENWLNKAKLFGINFSQALIQLINGLPNITKGNPKILGASIPNLMIEDFENVMNHVGNYGLLHPYLGENILLMEHNDLMEACDNYNLPVIARNNLENGESKNLWYEQIVPHQSRFVFYTVSLNTDEFTPAINEKTIQIGANSSLGYGYCKITKIS